MQESSKQNYLHGAAMMTAGVVVIKILGAIYKIPLGNILGDEGYGYFSVAYNIYYVFLNMATAGSARRTRSAAPYRRARSSAWPG